MNPADLPVREALVLPMPQLAPELLLVLQSQEFPLLQALLFLHLFQAGQQGRVGRLGQMPLQDRLDPKLHLIPLLQLLQALQRFQGFLELHWLRVVPRGLEIRKHLEHQQVQLVQEHR